MYNSPKYAHFAVSPKPETLPLPPKEWRIDIKIIDDDDDNKAYFVEKNIKYNKIDTGNF